MTANHCCIKILIDVEEHNKLLCREQHLLELKISILIALGTTVLSKCFKVGFLKNTNLAKDNLILKMIKNKVMRLKISQYSKMYFHHKKALIKDIKMEKILILRMLHLMIGSI